MKIKKTNKRKGKGFKYLTSPVTASILTQVNPVYNGKEIETLIQLLEE
jgi:hypothetical protein